MLAAHAPSLTRSVAQEATRFTPSRAGPRDLDPSLHTPILMGLGLFAEARLPATRPRSAISGPTGESIYASADSALDLSGTAMMARSDQRA